MSKIGFVTAATAVAVLTTSGVAAAAKTAPVVSKEVLSMRKTAPLTIPGTGVKKGAPLPRGAQLVFRTVTLEKGQRARVTLGAPRGMTLRGLVPGANEAIGFTVEPFVPYVGRRFVTVRAYVAPNAAAGKHTGRIWALVS
jgi:hypothetical protein